MNSAWSYVFGVVNSAHTINPKSDLVMRLIHIPSESLFILLSPLLISFWIFNLVDIFVHLSVLPAIYSSQELFVTLCRKAKYFILLASILFAVPVFWGSTWILFFHIFLLVMGMFLTIFYFCFLIFFKNKPENNV